MSISSNLASNVFSGLFAIAASSIILAFAAAPAEAATIKVSGYDLSTEQGRAAIDARIIRAAKQVCGVNNGAMNLQAKRFAEQCVAETVADTRERVAAYRASAQLAAR